MLSTPRSRRSRAKLVIAFAALLAVLVVFVVARFEPSSEARADTARMPLPGANAPDEPRESISAPTDEVAHDVAVNEAVARTASARPSHRETEREPSFTLELVIETPGRGVSALEHAKIEVVADGRTEMTKSKDGAVRTTEHAGRILRCRNEPVQVVGPLSLGRWKASIEARGFVTQRQAVTCNEDGARVRVTLRLLPQRVFVVAIHDVQGAPLDRSALLSADVRAQLADRIVPHVCEDAPRGALDSRSSCTAATYRCTHVGKDRDIEFEVETGGAGTLWVGASFGDAILAWSPVAENSERIVLEVPTEAVLAAFRSVEVRVRDRDLHASIDGAQVSVTMANGKELKLLTDATGRARAESVVQGAGTIRVSKEGYASETARFDTRSAAQTALEVELAPEVTLRGMLVGKDGLPSEGTVVAIAEAPERLPHDDLIPDRARAGENGGFEFRGLSRNTYLIADARFSSELVRHLSRSPSEPGFALPAYVTRVDARHGSVSGIVVRARTVGR